VAFEEARGGTALVASGDRDTFQLASERTTILQPQTGGGALVRIGPAEVRERYGVEPAQVPDFIALRGDPSDGIPGAKGVGEKTAASLLNRHGSLEGTLTGKLAPVADQLRTYKDMASLRQLDVERPDDRETDRAGGADAVRAHGMNRLAERLASSTG
jgi:DNA polymerase-1